jgi:hypothetical protein
VAGFSSTGLITSLASFVQTLNLSTGIANSLDAKLQNVLQALDDARAGDSPSVCNRIVAFLNEVRAQTGKSISEAQSAQLASAAGQIRASLACQ